MIASNYPHTKVRSVFDAEIARLQSVTVDDFTAYSKAQESLEVLQSLEIVATETVDLRDLRSNLNTVCDALDSIV